MKKFILTIVQFFIKFSSPILKPLLNHISPTIIVLVDGGICSQMRQYLMADVFIQKGYDVELNLSFFKNGFDMNGEQVRNFDLEKTFPHLKVKKASRLKIFLYKSLFPYVGHYPKDDSINWVNLKSPSIMLGYFADPDWLYKRMPEVFKVDKSVLDKKNLELYNSISEKSVAIHVRRGDLAVVDTIGFYGAPASVDYFIKAINYLNERFSGPDFYFFSDDVQYVKEKIITNIDNSIKCHLITNGSEKGYYDLLLISKCSHQITSKGSLGKFGACMNTDRGVVIVVKDELQLGPLLTADKEIIRM